MVMGFSILLMVTNMKETGKMIIELEMERLLGLMVITMKESFMIIK